MGTYSAKPKDITRKWLVIDAKDIPIGKVAVRAASLLRGKHKPEYTPHIDTGDAVIVINAALVKATGNKELSKVYYHHTGFPGGIKSIDLKGLREKDARQIITKAVKGMLPRGPLGRQMFSKLRVYSGAEHEHEAQNPELVEVV